MVLTLGNDVISGPPLTERPKKFRNADHLYTTLHNDKFKKVPH
jgi:hypothetical protein